mmetsp:Transcript_16476/g.33634  ORF Transcript_16476/g.33634 Transcript_16476/m.33634 type:complete len:121 (+) Transcript_16476:692-1054(+)
MHSSWLILERHLPVGVVMISVEKFNRLEFLIGPGRKARTVLINPWLSEIAPLGSAWIPSVVDDYLLNIFLSFLVLLDQGLPCQPLLLNISASLREMDGKYAIPSTFCTLPSCIFSMITAM